MGRMLQYPQCMSAKRMVQVVSLLTVAGAAIGGLLGLLFGLLLPDFYLTTVGPGNPVQIGLGFGIAQGIMMGFILGCLVIIIVAWRDKNRQG